MNFKLKNLNKSYIFLIAIFIAVYLWFIFYLAIKKTQLFDGDGLSRSLFAMMIRDIFTDLLKGRISSVEDIKSILSFYHSHYQVGLEAFFIWPPLQTFFLFIYFIFTKSASYISVGYINLIFLALLIFYLFRLTLLLFNNYIIATLASAFVLLHPFIMQMSISLERIIGESFFVVAMLYYLFLFIESKIGKYVLLAIIYFVLGCLFRIESFFMMILPLSIGIFLGVRGKESSGFIVNIWRRNKKLALVMLTLSLVLFFYIALQIPLTSKKVGTLFTKAESYKNWVKDKRAYPGIFTASKYFNFEDQYYNYRFSQKRWLEEKKNNPNNYEALVLADNRFSLSFYQKSFFIITCFFYELILIPCFLFFFIFSASRLNYKTALLMLSIFLYFLLYSILGTVPFYPMTVLPLIAILCAYGLFRFVDRFIWQKLKLTVLFFAISLGILQCFWLFTFGQFGSLYSRYASPGKVMDAIVKDNNSEEKFTVLSSFETALPLSLELVKNGKFNNIYIRPLYKHQRNQVVDFVRKGGYGVESKFMGKVFYPEAKYFFVMNLDEFDFWLPDSEEQNKIFALSKTIPAERSEAYLFKRIN
ncbi:MAG: hypothetical protein PHO70_00370 [Candidatus Omnitrophica bacterium]|nr:hypothetical protein [Candidatus Omnitrophota bacterium]